MHALGNIDGLEISGEGAHQFACALLRGAREEGRQFVNLRARFAALDGGAPDPLDLRQEFRPHLFGQDFTDQRAELFHVLAQQAVGRRELEVAQGLVGGFCQGRTHQPSLPELFELSL